MSKGGKKIKDAVFYAVFCKCIWPQTQLLLFFMASAWNIPQAISIKLRGGLREAINLFALRFVWIMPDKKPCWKWGYWLFDYNQISKINWKTPAVKLSMLQMKITWLLSLVSLRCYQKHNIKKPRSFPVNPSRVLLEAKCYFASEASTSKCLGMRCSAGTDRGATSWGV